ncbi:16S rRNA methyltransferase [Endozoicomonas sp. OPT23]|uniref:class I SAM-dependent methyltransferase n=1 Tax=Endozoicomonas sp. OPT23 TaxID=2072845 RepID=UPI00129A95D6|nr:class I SAM-dependent methyltransferase [Endozoicomonas sp. OPT23]MRI34695.1 16S rRNA methyltransferase [Endozoicomonas sp. OPT23]
MSNQPLANPSQLILRNSTELECSRLLMVGMPADGLAEKLIDEGVAESIHGLTKDYSVFSAIDSRWQSNESLSLEFGPIFKEQSGSYDGALIFLQKSKPLMAFWLDMVHSLLSDKAIVWLVGENGEGIKSWRKKLKERYGDVRNLDNARHCSLIEASAAKEDIKPFNLDNYWSEFDLQASDQELKIRSLPGVFSHGRVDVGTKVLLETMQQIPEGPVLDFGCGAGVISAFMSVMQPANTYTLVDVDALALASSETTMQLNGVKDFEVKATDGLSEVKDSFKLIVSNPPFHQGVKTHYAVTEEFLDQAANRLTRGGELRIVANNFLRYQPIILKAFGNCESLVVKDGFTVYKAIKK